jgi:hypothetical protein
MIKKLLSLSLLSLSVLGCSKEINYFECEGRSWNVFHNYTSNEEILSKKTERNISRELRIMESIFGYEINGSSCKTDNNGVLGCGKSECFMELATQFKDSPACKDTFWVYYNFDKLSGLYYHYIYIPRKSENEYTYEQVDMRCQRKPAALN